jgi:hypothetical protein
MAEMSNVIGSAGSGAAAGASIAGPIGAAVGGIIGGIAGFFGGGSQRRKAEELLQKALAEIEAVGAPPDLSREIILETFKQEGMYVPELEQEVDLALSKVSQIKENPELRDAQMQALRQIQERAEGGLAPEDRAALEKVKAQVAGQVRGQEQSILQEMQQRGQAGSGSELAARLLAGQAGAQRASDAGIDIAGQASRAALEAAARAGSMSGDIRRQDFDVDKTKASAEDERNRFLFENSTALRGRNVAARNLAQQQNLSERQRISDINTGMTNAERQRQADAQRKYWEDKLKYAQSKTDLMTNQSNQKLKNAAEVGQSYKDIGTGIGTVFGKILK